MIHHLNRAAGLCLTAALLLTAAGCGQQTVPESPSPSPWWRPLRQTRTT